MSPETRDRSVPFDPDSGSGPEGVLLPPRDGGEVVALLVDASVRGDLWGERAAVALAREWTSRGRKVVLIDGDVETPSLHELLQVPNLEGLSDALLYGASLERVVTTPPGESFRFVASGTVVADPSALRSSPRWDAFLGQMRSRGEVAILFLPTGGSGSALLFRMMFPLASTRPDEASTPRVQVVRRSHRGRSSMTGITAIVGPNGCGKSNISDAIRWVLGEQRPRRSAAPEMEEAIFQGTVNRRPGEPGLGLHGGVQRGRGPSRALRGGGDRPDRLPGRGERLLPEPVRPVA
jgi:hypothetical protein